MPARLQGCAVRTGNGFGRRSDVKDVRVRKAVLPAPRRERDSEVRTLTLPGLAINAAETVRATVHDVPDAVDGTRPWGCLFHSLARRFLPRSPRHTVSVREGVSNAAGHCLAGKERIWAPVLF